MLQPELWWYLLSFLSLYTWHYCYNYLFFLFLSRYPCPGVMVFVEPSFLSRWPPLLSLGVFSFHSGLWMLRMGDETEEKFRCNLLVSLTRKLLNWLCMKWTIWNWINWILIGLNLIVSLKCPVETFVLIWNCISQIKLNWTTSNTLRLVNDSRWLTSHFKGYLKHRAVNEWTVYCLRFFLTQMSDCRFK